MKKRTILLLIIFCVFSLVGGIYWRAKTWQEDLKKVFSSSKINFDFEETNFDSFFNQGEITQKEFISPDGKLKIDYSSDWIESQKNELESLTQSFLQEKAKFILLARKIDTREGVALLIVQEIERESESLPEIIEKMKEKSEKMEIINSNIEEKEAYIELIYKKDSSSFQSKERFILGDQKVYLIAILAQEQDWGEFKEETEKILTSARIIE